MCASGQRGLSVSRYLVAVALGAADDGGEERALLEAVRRLRRLLPDDGMRERLAVRSLRACHFGAGCRVVRGSGAWQGGEGKTGESRETKAAGEGRAVLSPWLEIGPVSRRGADFRWRGANLPKSVIDRRLPA